MECDVRERVHKAPCLYARPRAFDVIELGRVYAARARNFAKATAKRIEI